jgi:hypothetical protein
MPHTPTADLTREPRPSEGSSGDARPPNSTTGLDKPSAGGHHHKHSTKRCDDHLRPPQLWRGRRQQDNRELVVLDGSRVGRHLLHEHFPEVAESLSGEFFCDYRDRLRAHLDVRVCFSTNVLQPCGRAGSTSLLSRAGSCASAAVGALRPRSAGREGAQASEPPPSARRSRSESSDRAVTIRRRPTFTDSNEPDASRRRTVDSETPPSAARASGRGTRIASATAASRGNVAVEVPTRPGVHLRRHCT